MVVLYDSNDEFKVNDESKSLDKFEDSRWPVRSRRWPRSRTLSLDMG